MRRGPLFRRLCGEVLALALLFATILPAATASHADSSSTPPFVGRSSYKIPSTAWSVAKLPSVLPGVNSSYRLYRGTKIPVGAIDGDSILVLLPPALDTVGVPDPNTDTAWTWLIPGITPGVLLPKDLSILTADTQVAAPGQVVRWEVDSLYYFGDAGLPSNNSTELTPGEGWYGNRLRAGFSLTVAIDLPWFTPTTETSSLRLRLHSASPPTVSPTHVLVVRVNAQIVDTIRWNGYQSFEGSIQVPTAILVSGTNSVQLQSLATGAQVNEVYVDWFELTAPQSLHPSSASLRFSPPIALVGRRVRFLIDGTAGDSVLVMRSKSDGSIEHWQQTAWNGTSWQFVDSVLADRTFVLTRNSAVRRPAVGGGMVVPDLRTHPLGADLVVIAPRAFTGSAQRLAAHRSAQEGIRVAVVPLEDIVDAFAAGRWGPDAIRSFLLTIDTTWPQPAPSAILLLGDGTWDPLDHLHTGKRGLIPTIGNPVSDAMYVVDTLDLFRQRKAIGRIPVRTLSEVDSVIDALIAYDAQSISRWNGRFLFFASGFDSLETIRFQQFSDALFSTHIAPAPVAGTQGRIYRTVEQVIDFERTEEVRRILDSGGVWINYYGHAGTDTWANGINRSDQLANLEGKAHLITDISCSTARFGEPLVESFGEMMVRSTSARALAYVGSSGFGFESPLRILAQGFFKAFAQGERRLGALHLAAKNELWNAGTSSLVNRQALHQWTLLGDPTARLRIARWPEYEIDAKSLVVEPAEPSEQDSVVRVSCRVDNIGLLTTDSVVVRLRVISESSTAVFDTVLPASRRSTTVVWDRAELRQPGFLTVIVTVNPDSLSAEESLSMNGSDLRYVVSSSRFIVMSPTDFSRSHPDSVRVIVLPPIQTGTAQTLEVELDTSESFSSLSRRQWSGIQLLPYATTFPIPSGNLMSGQRYLVRTRLVAGAVTTPWITRIVTTGASTSWIQDNTSGWNGTQTQNIVSAGTWRLDERRVPVRVMSAGFSDGIDVSVWLDEVNISQGFTSRGYNIAVVNESTGQLESFAAFSIYSDNADTTLAEPLIQYLQAIPNGRRVLVGVSDEASKNKTEQLNREFENIGSSQIRSLGFRGSWAISGRKGAPIGTVPEARSNEGQGPVSVVDTLLIRPDSGSIISSTIGPASDWSRVNASFSDTGASAHVTLRAIRSTTSGVLDTIVVVPGSGDLHSWGREVRTIRLMASLTRDPNAQSPRVTSWSVDFGGLAEAAISPSTARFVQDSVDAGLPLRLLLPIRNVGVAAIDTLPYRLRWRWPLGETNMIGTLNGLTVGEEDTVRAELPTSAVRGKVELEAVLDPGLVVAQWERGNDILRRQGFVIGDTIQPRFHLFVDGRTIVDGDYVRPNPTVRIEITDDGAVPIASPSNVTLRINGRSVILGTTTSDSLFESMWSDHRAIVTYRPNLAKGTHVLGIRVNDGSGNPADTSEYLLTMRVEPEASLRNVVAFPNPFASETDLTFNLTGQNLPDGGSVRVYTIAGRLIREIDIQTGQLQTGFNAIPWDGRDAEGDEVANGVYLAVVKVKTGDKWLQETAKLAKLR